MAQTAEQLPDLIDELTARAEAGQKLGLQALEFVMNLAAANNLTLDFEGAAKAMVDNPAALSAGPVERRSRQITSDYLKLFADEQRRRPANRKALYRPPADQ